MRLKIVSISNQPDNPGLLQLKKSLDYFEYDYHIIQDKPYIWFGTKIIETYNYVKTIQDEYTHFIFVDAHDVVFINTPKMLYATINQAWFTYGIGNIFSCEKNCWPNPNLATAYPECASDWKYLNSGSYLFNIQDYIKMVEEFKLTDHKFDDQLWCTNRYLDGKYNIILDYECVIFQSLGFQDKEKDFDFAKPNVTFPTGGVYNKKTLSFPIILHGNGGDKEDMKQSLELLDNIINQSNELA